MARVKRGFKARRRRKKILKLAKGYWGANSRLIKTARNIVVRAHRFAYRDRRTRKRDFRRLWIIRIKAAVKQHGLSYSKFIHGLKLSAIEIDRKILAEIALLEPAAFGKIVQVAQKALEKA